jgi:chitinase
MKTRVALALLVAAGCAGIGACGSSNGSGGAGGAGDGGSGSSSGASGSSSGASTSGSSGGGSGGSSGGSSGGTSGGSSGGTASSSGSSGGDGGSGGSKPWVMGYYASWHAPANGGNYAVSSIDWDGLTHVAAAFYLPDGSGGWASGTFDSATAMELIAAGHAQGKKVLASIGGAGSGPVFEQSMQNAMSTFVTNLEALVSMGYDGLDIDWEGGNLTTQQDQMLEQSLVTALRQHSPSAIVTLTAGYENENLLDDLSWYGTMASQLDQINLMTYGMAGAYQGWESWHSSPLHWNMVSSTPTGIDSSVAHYLAAHVPASKLGVGIGFYGMCYSAPVTAPVQMLGASQVKASDGTMSYPNIMSSYYAASAYHYDSAAAVPFLTLSGSNAQGCTYVSYEDPTSIAAKGAWVKAQALGGAIIWEIGEGFVPSAATVQTQNPLLEVTKTAFLQ